MTFLLRAWCRLTSHRWRRLRKADNMEAVLANAEEEFAHEVYEADPLPIEFSKRLRICRRCGATRLAAKRARAA